ncbi:serologically defined colon cancer antigen 8 homolog [Stylophora pistillata]|uniref:serologically defined colon cancer antigen 8 homolog n=1 Tax=Stylophora pistillata TaxID=50429 RepID=UPI000C03DD8E|nr:serologically defined colon cancer antigen 8 homolog [Stylophora pistillata]
MGSSYLYLVRDELEDYQRQVSELQAKLRAQKVLEDQRGQPALCVKCGHHSAVLSNTHSEAAIDTINQLTKERDDLMNMLTGQKAVLAEVRQREFEAYNQVKKSCHMVEQAQLEKAEAIIHVRQLREDLRKGRERHENNMRMFSEKMDKEREKVKEACWEEVSGLNKQIESSSEARSALENQLERLTREKVGLMAELEQANSQILANASEVSKVFEFHQANETVEKELEQTQMRLSVASQELNSVKASAQQAQREREQMCQLLATRNDLMKERKVLSQEDIFLRKQKIPKTLSEPVTPFMETASNASAEDPDRMTEEKERHASVMYDLLHPSVYYEPCENDNVFLCA